MTQKINKILKRYESCPFIKLFYNIKKYIKNINIRRDGSFYTKGLFLHVL